MEEERYTLYLWFMCFSYSQCMSFRKCTECSRSNTPLTVQRLFISEVSYIRKCLLFWNLKHTGWENWQNYLCAGFDDEVPTVNMLLALLCPYVIKVNGNFEGQISHLRCCVSFKFWVTDAHNEELPSFISVSFTLLFLPNVTLLTFKGDMLRRHYNARDKEVVQWPCGVW
jgi:hypothetical protein